MQTRTERFQEMISKCLRSKKGMNVGGVMSDKEDSYFQKEMERKTSESKDRSNENMKFVRRIFLN
jgi:hypothetical protein